SHTMSSSAMDVPGAGRPTSSISHTRQAATALAHRKRCTQDLDSTNSVAPSSAVARAITRLLSSAAQPIAVPVTSSPQRLATVADWRTNSPAAARRSTGRDAPVSSRPDTSSAAQSSGFQRKARAMKASRAGTAIQAPAPASQRTGQGVPPSSSGRSGGSPCTTPAARRRCQRPEARPSSMFPRPRKMEKAATGEGDLRQHGQGQQQEAERAQVQRNQEQAPKERGQRGD